MSDRIDKETIKKAIDKLQADHPCHFAYNPTIFESMENVNSLSHAIDMVAKRMGEDSEINIICEFAKLYLEGVRPTIEHKQRECNQCRYYEGVHGVQGHAPCSFWEIGGVLWNDYCSRLEKEGDEK